MTKNLIAICFIVGVALCAVAAGQTVDELLQKNLAARGGLDKVRATKSIRMTAKVHTDNIEIAASVQIKRTGMARIDAEFQGMKIVQAYDGEVAWQINAPEGKTEPEKMSGDDEKDVREMGDIDGPLVDYKAKGNAVELVGKEDLEATPVYKLKVTEKNGAVRYFYLDCKSYLELKVSSKRKVEGKDVTADEYFGDYKSVGGLMMPHSIESRVDGHVDNQIVIEKIELDVDIDDGIFKMPKKPEAKPAKGA